MVEQLGRLALLAAIAFGARATGVRHSRGGRRFVGGGQPSGRSAAVRDRTAPGSSAAAAPWPTRPRSIMAWFYRGRPGRFSTQFFACGTASGSSRGARPSSRWRRPSPGLAPKPCRWPISIASRARPHASSSSHGHTARSSIATATSSARTPIYTSVWLRT